MPGPCAEVTSKTDPGAYGGTVTRRSRSRGLLAALFVGAGALHFTSTEAYVGVMPPYLPAPRALVLISGVGEIAGGLAVLAPTLRRPAGWLLIALLIAVFPANVHMALQPEELPGVPPLLLWLRLPLQALLIGWVWSATLRRGA